MSIAKQNVVRLDAVIIAIARQGRKVDHIYWLQKKEVLVLKRQETIGTVSCVCFQRMHPRIEKKENAEKEKCSSPSLFRPHRWTDDCSSSRRSDLLNLW